MRVTRRVPIAAWSTDPLHGAQRQNNAVAATYAQLLCAARWTSAKTLQLVKRTHTSRPGPFRYRQLRRVVHGGERQRAKACWSSYRDTFTADRSHGHDVGRGGVDQCTRTRIGRRDPAARQPAGEHRAGAAATGSPPSTTRRAQEGVGDMNVSEAALARAAARPAGVHGRERRARRPWPAADRLHHLAARRVRAGRRQRRERPDLPDHGDGRRPASPSAARSGPAA